MTMLLLVIFTLVFIYFVKPGPQKRGGQHKPPHSRPPKIDKDEDWFNPDIV